ncbi:MAG: MBOAT family protein [Crocosphaera sp.]
MLFNSLEFPIFLILVYIAYRLLPFRGQNTLLLIASYIFYGWWDERFLFLIVLSTTIDFWCGLMIDDGSLRIRDRCLSSVFLLLASLIFIILKWETIIYNSSSFNVFSNQWLNLIPSSLSEWSIFLLTLGFIVLANLSYFSLSKLPEKRKKKLFLIFSICSNLGILAIFKYFNFFVDSAEIFFKTLGIEIYFPSLNVILPVGISFYTFQTMSYTIDIYRGQLKATNHFFDFALFVSFFPQLVAGPIERASELLPRILKRRKLSWQQSTRGLYLILFGLFKKIAIADSIAQSVNSIYETNTQVSGLDIVLGTGLFAIQIYCDFSGYSDIARGVSKLFGIELMYNFNLPYFSQNPSEFWKRWHISLSSWLRDYLYIPLGGNRRGNVYANLMITMVLGGIWHGAGWNFILWGFYQGFLLCMYRLGTKVVPSFNLLPKSWSIITSLIKTIIFFIFTCYGWLLFRANSFQQIMNFTQILLTDLTNWSLSLSNPTMAGLFGLPLLIVYELFEYLQKSPHFYLNLPATLRGMLYALFTTLIIMGMSNEPEQFIYFQF